VATTCFDVSDGMVIASAFDQPEPITVAEQRPNVDLEALFAEPIPVPVRVPEVLRHNPDLDAAFGV
jgi:hypothetical protein